MTGKKTLAEQLSAATDEVDVIMDAVAGYKAKAIGLGFTSGIAEQMAADFQAQLIAKVFGAPRAVGR